MHHFERNIVWKSLHSILQREAKIHCKDVVSIMEEELTSSHTLTGLAEASPHTGRKQHTLES